MSIDNRERFYDPEENMRMAMNSHSAGIWTSLPAIVTKYNPAANTVECQPTIKGVIQDKSGNYKAVTLPVLPDVPVVFPRGGGATLTFPIKVGDECLVVFACRNIDSWWQSSGVQIPMDARQHDLSDGFALMGVMSKPKVIPAISTKTAQLRSDDGKTYVELDPAGKVTIEAPAGVVIHTNADCVINAAKNVQVTADHIEMTAPSGVQINADVIINGNISTTLGEENGGGNMTIAGTIHANGDVTAGNISLQNHTHGGVQSGGSDTEKPK